MICIEWAPIAESAEIPPFGENLQFHLKSRSGANRSASCSAWNLLHRVLTEHGLPIGTVAFTKTGKPYFIDRPLCFSISHSKELCAVAVADHPVGVDVERRREHYHPHLVERSLSEREKAEFDGDFIRLWCRKEAIAKMTGTGIVGFPRNIDTKEGIYCFHDERITFHGADYWLAAVEEAEIEKA